MGRSVLHEKTVIPTHPRCADQPDDSADGGYGHRRCWTAANPRGFAGHSAGSDGYRGFGRSADVLRPCTRPGKVVSALRRRSDRRGRKSGAPIRPARTNDDPAVLVKLVSGLPGVLGGRLWGGGTICTSGGSASRPCLPRGDSRRHAREGGSRIDGMRHYRHSVVHGCGRGALSHAGTAERAVSGGFRFAGAVASRNGGYAECG